MKKHYLAAAAVVAMLGFSGSALAYGDGAGITGSPHDFTDGLMLNGNVNASGVTNEAWNFRKEICRVCHSPHDKQRQAYTAGLLWNRALSTATYEPYVFTEKAGNVPGGPNGGPVRRAKMCLSCHDNTVALGQFDSYADGAANTKTNGALTFQQIYDDDHFMIGTVGTTQTLAGTHPISVDYATAVAANTGNQMNPVTTVMGNSGTIADVLDGGLVQCSSCHDVHNRVSAAGTRLLRVGQEAAAKSIVDGTKTFNYAGGVASGLCLTCHNK